MAQLLALGFALGVSAGVAGVLKSALSGVLTIVWSLLTGDFYTVLIKIPIIGIIVAKLDVIVQAKAGVSLKAGLTIATVKVFVLGKLLVNVVSNNINIVFVFKLFSNLFFQLRWEFLQVLRQL